MDRTRLGKRRPGDKYPIRYTFAVGCASAAMGAARRVSARDTKSECSLLLVITTPPAAGTLTAIAPEPNSVSADIRPKPNV
jgi:hypothetical protein